MRFVFYCIGCENNVNDFNAKKLLDVQRVIENNLEENDISNDFRRALLTVGDNKFYEYWWSWLYAADAPKRCLIVDINDLQRNFAYNKDDRFRNYLKELLIQLTREKLTDIIRNYDCPATMPNWEKRLIKKDKLLDYSWRHYIAIAQDNSCCWLIPGSRIAATAEGKKRLKEVR
jgi:hypothetical protein